MHLNNELCFAQSRDRQGQRHEINVSADNDLRALRHGKAQRGQRVAQFAASRHALYYTGRRIDRLIRKSCQHGNLHEHVPLFANEPNKSRLYCAIPPFPPKASVTKAKHRTRFCIMPSACFRRLSNTPFETLRT